MNNLNHLLKGKNFQLLNYDYVVKLLNSNEFFKEFLVNNCEINKIVSTNDNCIGICLTFGKRSILLIKEKSDFNLIFIENDEISDNKLCKENRLLSEIYKHIILKTINYN